MKKIQILSRMCSKENRRIYKQINVSVHAALTSSPTHMTKDQDFVESQHWPNANKAAKKAYCGIAVAQQMDDKQIYY